MKVKIEQKDGQAVVLGFYGQEGLQLCAVSVPPSEFLDVKPGTEYRLVKVVSRAKGARPARDVKPRTPTARRAPKGAKKKR